MDLISVIVPVYKTEKYLDRCVNSIVNQTYKNLEIILVDDGSPDRCPELCDRWAEKDNRIKVIHQENGGPSVSRNAGLRIATGEYIGFVDSDDWIEKDMYEHLLKLLKENGADFSAVEMAIVKSENDAVNQEKNETTVLESDALFKIFFRVSGNELKYCVCDKLFSREAIKNIPFPEGFLFEDIYYNFLVLKKCGKAVYSNQKKYFWFYNYGSITRNKLTHNDMQVLEIWKNILTQCEKELPQYSYYAQMNYKRANMAVLGKYVKYGLSDDYPGWRKDRSNLIKSLRNSYFDLLKWKMPFSRKILLTGLCISPELCSIPFRIIK